MRARGNIGVDLAWSKGALDAAVLTAGSAGKVRVQLRDASIDLTLRAGERVRVTAADGKLRAQRLK
jgi:alpha-L-fucosidase 2